MNVYLKGCPLRCVWCHSPESQSPKPEVVWYETKCVRCGACIDACPEGIRGFGLMSDGERARCRLCGACVSVCSARALEVKGRRVPAGEVADEAARLKPFFRRTGGGVTLSGGEPTAQPAFALAVASLCREAGIHVAMETCGFVEWRVLSRLSGVVDLFLFDVKHVAPGPHRRYTGASNRRILNNLKRLCEVRVEVIVRVPLIPGVNDDADTIRTIARRVTGLGAGAMTLLPFNPATHAKYSWLRRKPPLPDATRQTPEHVLMLQEIVRDEGLQVVAP